MNETKKKNIFAELKWYEHIVAGLPLILIILGGAIGGLCGGAAYVASATTFRKEDLSTPMKYLFSALISFMAFALYFIFIIFLSVLFPGVFEK